MKKPNRPPPKPPIQEGVPPPQIPKNPRPLILNPVNR